MDLVGHGKKKLWGLGIPVIILSVILGISYIVRIWWNEPKITLVPLIVFMIIKSKIVLH